MGDFFKGGFYVRHHPGSDCNLSFTVMDFCYIYLCHQKIANTLYCA
jgi:hypothetical protein